MRSTIAVVVVFAAALAIAAIAFAGDGRGAAAASPFRIADVSTTDLRAVLTATRAGNGGQPTARVTVVTFKRAAGRWTRTGRHVLPGSYFWHTVTAPHAICRLDLRGGVPTQTKRPRVAVQLLTTPSIGCGRVHEFVLGDS